MILRKIIKNVANRCHIVRLKCTKFDFGLDSAPDPSGGTHSAPPDSLDIFQGYYFLGKRRDETKRGKGQTGKEREGRGREGKGCVMALGVVVEIPDVLCN